jgi:hypothetical protein
MRALSRLADVAGFWTLDRTTITGRSAVILRQHTTPFRPLIAPFDDLELVYQSLKLKPLHTRKFPRVNAQDSRLGASALSARESTLGRASDHRSLTRRHYLWDRSVAEPPSWESWHGFTKPVPSS